MESQLQTLIEKIQNDGIAEAEKKAQSLLTEAKQKADGLVADAKTQAAEIVDNAKVEAARTEEAGNKALEQAGRNLILGLRSQITELLDQLTKKEIGTALQPEQLAQILEKAVGNWNANTQDAGELEVLLSKEDADALAKGLIAKLQKKAKAGVVLRPQESIDAGFRIGEKDSSVYYDFTDQGLAEILSKYVGPKLAELLNVS